jgi:hypothetical protein
MSDYDVYSHISRNKLDVTLLGHEALVVENRLFEPLARLYSY